jgi:DNA-binding transcriptional MerR regulator
MTLHAEGSLRAVAKAQDLELTIDELAQRSGVTVRNIRAHQSRGLLPPPEVRARTGYYGPEHVARLKLIREMQADGFNLRSIQRLVDRLGASGEEILDFQRLIMTPFETEEPEFVDREELGTRFGGEFDEKITRKAERLGVVVPLGEDRWEVPSPTLLRAGEEVVALGVDLETALKVVERIKRHAEAVSETFVKLYMDEVFKPFQRAGQPPEKLPEVQEALERLRPLASETLVSIFRLSMTRAVERTFGKTLRG